ncbi:MAG: amino acid ABC transporter substrate-binding protein [Clostridium cadaveris]|uniref:Amino acid ABC transporter substrate-binding protein n=1 Tax=Clostridium cadaveris TaxID=1529 RepID=A0A1I2KDM4_9CLOT|nr:amino acid ABC transporter substrate-binding protein [Clostridium cadaveris]MDM8313489.1 amino acid ABC transporter substrate-binding protein [Clostridium cadaveris]MDY4950376.1 amino acid ABC transporter substrate-binding protein [Clostridium cadaveris]PWL54906.1 MAG: amino acid ABC transporter substrate-binding protein [Clostridium cadaveris]SFF65145.1 amino acid ABC transporter substrate-binding protein, PAAT family [Clostridium cadaveris]
MKSNIKVIKKITVIIMLVLLSVNVVACGKDSVKADENNDTVIIGLDDTFVPMGYKDEKGEIVGFDVDLAKEIFKRSGRKVKFQPVDWTMKESELNQGNIDLIWNGYSVTEERKEQVKFSDAYLDNRQVIIVLATSKLSSKEDLKGAKVGTQSESSSLEAINKEQELTRNFKDGQLVLFDTYNDALMDLDAGRLDAVVVDEILARYYMKQRGEERFKILNGDFGKEIYAVGARKDDEELINDINKYYKEIKEDGTGENICNKWFGENILK